MSAASDTGTGETEARVLEDWMSGPAVVPVMAALGDGGVDIRFVGGCVRDALLGRPVSDIDIGVPLPPDEAVRRLEAARTACRSDRHRAWHGDRRLGRHGL